MRVLSLSALVTLMGGCSLLFGPAGEGMAIDAGPFQDSVDLHDAGPIDQVKVWSGSTALHTCASKGAQVVCWGDNTYGQLGSGDRLPGAVARVRSPFSLPGDVVEMTLSSGHTCALLDMGDVYCWGRNGGGELGLIDGLDDYAPATIPVPIIQGGQAAAHISAGYDYTCASMVSGKLRCWGHVLRLIESFTTLPNDDNNWGLGEYPESKPDIPIDFDVLALGVGVTHGCAVSRDGISIRCWGDEDGDAAGDLNLKGELITYASGIRQIASGEAFSCLLDANGRVNCWGNDDYGQLGAFDDPYLEPVPEKVLNFNTSSPAEQVIVSAHHGCARFGDGSVRCWGRGYFGATGLGHRNSIGLSGDLTETLVAFDDVAVSIAAGAYHTCVAFGSGAVRCFGSNKDDQLGTGASCGSLGGDNNECNYGDAVTELPVTADDLMLFE